MAKNSVGDRRRGHYVPRVKLPVKTDYAARAVLELAKAQLRKAREEGKAREAEPLYCLAVEGAAAALGEAHPRTQLYRKNYAAFLAEQRPA